ncbi:MAG: Arsenate reductase glutaredoxin-coupled, partial [uncultured Acetobacteraceae bacterium]
DGRHHLPQPGLRHVAQRPRLDPQQRRGTACRRVPEDAAEPGRAGRADRAHGHLGAGFAAPEGHAPRRARVGRSGLERRRADRRHDGAPHPHQPADRGHAPRREALPAVRSGARPPARAAARGFRQGGRRSGGGRAGRARPETRRPV